MRKQLIVLALIAVGTLGCVSLAHADSLTLNDSRYLGSIDPGTPSSPTDEVGYINHLIDMLLNSSETFLSKNYVRTGVSCGTCPDAVLADSITDETDPLNPIDLGSGFTYLLGKFGNTDHVWYVAGLTGTGHTLPDTIGQAGGLSHWAVFDPAPPRVPEPSSLLLLGSALTALGVARRRLLK